MGECSGIFATRYEVHLPRSVQEHEVPLVHRALVQALAVPAEQVNCHRHDPCHMDPEDHQAEWVLATIMETALRGEPHLPHPYDIVSQALYRHFKRRRTVLVTNPAGDKRSLLYAQ